MGGSGDENDGTAWHTGLIDSRARDFFSLNVCSSFLHCKSCFFQNNIIFHISSLYTFLFGSNALNLIK